MNLLLQLIFNSFFITAATAAALTVVIAGGIFFIYRRRKGDKQQNATPESAAGTEETMQITAVSTGAVPDVTVTAEADAAQSNGMEAAAAARTPPLSLAKRIAPYVTAGEQREEDTAGLKFLSAEALEVRQILRDTGFAYDTEQEIFYTLINAWQRDCGYCELYDEAAAPCGIILDREIIYFVYDNRRYLIEFWKGQYGIATGGEVGVYKDTGREVLNCEMFETVGNDEMPNITLTLVRRGLKVFRRSGRHWWQTGFKLGLFSIPSELAAHISIDFPDCGMCAAFINALKELGYKQDEAFARGTTAVVYFDAPKSDQAATRTEPLESIVLETDKRLSEAFNNVIQDGNIFEVLAELRKSNPHMFNAAVKINGRGTALKPFFKK